MWGISSRYANVPAPTDSLASLAPGVQNDLQCRPILSGGRGARELREEVDSRDGMLGTEKICERQDQALSFISFDSPPSFLPKNLKLTWMNDGNRAEANLPTIALNKSGSTSPIACPALRKRCMISSPTKIPPDSENVGARNRARRCNSAVRPGVPFGDRLGRCELMQGSRTGKDGAHHRISLSTSLRIKRVR